MHYAVVNRAGYYRFIIFLSHFALFAGAEGLAILQLLTVAMLTSTPVSVGPDAHVLVIDALSLTMSSTRGLATRASIHAQFVWEGNGYRITPELYLQRASFTKEACYQNKFEVWENEVHIGTLRTDARYRTLQGKLNFTFRNEVFYSGPGWPYYYQRLQEALCVQAVSISKLDIALDRNKSILPELARVVAHSTLSKYNEEQRYSPVLGNLSYTFHSGDQHVFGKYTGNAHGKQVAVYSKSKEAEERQKTYIRRFHALNGLDPDLPVERIEVRMCSSYLSKLKLCLIDLQSPEYLAAIFIKAVGRALTFNDLPSFYYDKKNRNPKYRNTLTLLDTSFLSARELVLPKKPTAVETGLRSNACITVKFLIGEYIGTGSPNAAAFIQEFMQRHPQPTHRSWATLLTRYAQAYQGQPGREQANRQEHILDLLLPAMVRPFDAPLMSIHRRGTKTSTPYSNNLSSEDRPRVA
ncbi:hypothetical protein [Hymenobacter jejuensis]|uniref:Uncharacterized protein n=1 Tax=Hymenobacter jejuensis TaxID=2502781 RepID=A0A5B8A2X7_9BACT|nr:hypothetical protein [Hymenobacter jejuensis]QDA61668.1 hypothetical protein FHG12_16885 [Hymenobacter jejuensis]